LAAGFAAGLAAGLAGAFTAFLTATGAAFTALRADFAAAGDAEGLDLAEDLTRGFLGLDEALAMASRRCVRETAGGLHHG
jgi:hypothetical protein